MRVKLVNRYGEVLILPEELSLKGWPDDTNLKGTEIEGRPGRIIDRPNSKLRPRIIRVAGYMAGIDKDDADKIREMIAGFVNEAGPFKIYRHDTADRYMYVYKKSMDHEYRTGHFEGKVFSLSLSFEAADPLFYSDEVTEEFYVTGDSVRVSAVNPNLPATNGLVDVQYVGTGWENIYYDYMKTTVPKNYVKIKFYGSGLVARIWYTGGVGWIYNIYVDGILTKDSPVTAPTGGTWGPLNIPITNTGKHEVKIELVNGNLEISDFDIMGSNLYLIDNPGTAESEPKIYIESAEREESFDYKGKKSGSLTRNKNRSLWAKASTDLTPSQVGWSEWADYKKLWHKNNFLINYYASNGYFQIKKEYDLSHLSPAYLNSLVYKGFHKAQGSNAGVKDYTYKVQAWDNVGQKYDDLGTGGLKFERGSEALKVDGTFASKHEPRFDHGGTKNLLPAKATKFDWKHSGFSYYDEIVGVTENCSNGKVSTSIKGKTLQNELNYNRDTWAEWTLLNGSSVANGILTVAFGSSPTATISAFFKNNTKYGFLFNKINTGRTRLSIIDGAFSTNYSFVSENAVVGMQKVIATSKTEITDNKLKFLSNTVAEEALSLKDLRVFELPAGSESEADFNNLTADQLVQKYPYIKGDSIKSTIGKVRLKSVGKNLFDGKWWNGYNFSGSPSPNAISFVNLVNGNTGETYRLSYGTIKSSSIVGFNTYDTNENVIRKDVKTNYLTLQSNEIFFDFFIYNSNGISPNDVTNILVEKGIATSYEPYTESNLYINAGQVLRSLLNGTKDEVSEGKLKKRVSGIYSIIDTDFVSITNGNNVQFVNFKPLPNQYQIAGGSVVTGAYSCPDFPEVPHTNSDSATSYYRSVLGTGKNLVFIVPLGTYASLADAQSKLVGTTLIYQLATPEVLPVESEGSLTAYQNGTLYAEPSFWGYIEPGNSTKTITDITLPAGDIRKVERIDIVDGKEVRVDVTSDCSLTDLNTAITINNPELGKRYFYDCSIAEGYSTNGEKTYFFEKAVTLTQGQVVAELEAVNATKVELVKGTDDIIYYTTVTPDKPKLEHTGSMYVKNIGTVPVVIGSQTIQPGTHTRATVSIPANTTEAKLAIKTTPETVPGTKLALMAWHPQIEEGATATEWVEGRSTGILIEEDTVNLMVGKTDFQTGWRIYDNSTATVTPGQVDPYGGAGAYRIQTSGGTSVIKYYTPITIPDTGKRCSIQVWLKNNNNIAMKMISNLGGEEKIVSANSDFILLKIQNLVGNGSTSLQIQFQTLNVSDNLDITVFQPQAEEKNYCTTYTPTTRATETLSIPAKGVLPLEGSMEIEFNYLKGPASVDRYLLAHYQGDSNRFTLRITTTGSLAFDTFNRTSKGTTQYYKIGYGKHTLRIKWNKESIVIYLNGIVLGIKDNPYLPDDYLYNLSIGCNSWLNPVVTRFNEPIHYLHFTSKQWTDAEMASPDRVPVDGDTTFVKDFSEENLDCITPFETTLTSPQKYIDSAGKVNFLVRSTYPADANISSYVYTDYVQMKASYQKATLGKNAVVLKARNLLENGSFEKIENDVPVGWIKLFIPSLIFADPKDGKVAVRGSNYTGSNYYQIINIVPYQHYRVQGWVKALTDTTDISTISINFLDASGNALKTSSKIIKLTSNVWTWIEFVVLAPENAVKLWLNAGTGSMDIPYLYYDGCVVDCLGDSPEAPSRQGYVEPLRKYLSFSSPVILARREVLSYSNTSQMRVQKNGESVLNQASTEMLIGGFPIQPGKQILEFNCPKDELWKVTLKYQPKYY
jgi:hypothetical protein